MQPSKVAREMDKTELTKYKKQVVAAKVKELDSWKKTNTYKKELYDAKLHSNCMTGRWVMTWKAVPDSDLGKWKADDTFDHKEQRRAKARYVLRGFQDAQKDDIRTDSPTESRRSMFGVLGLAALRGWRVRSADVSTAFLQGKPLEGERAIQVVPPVEADEPPNVVWP